MAIEWNIGAEIQPRSPSRGDEAIAALAAGQHGVVSRAQLLGLGFGAGAIEHRVASGRLQPLHPGVYAVGHRALRRHATWMAAVLAGGTDTVLASRSGGALWRMRDSAVLEVISPRKLRRPGIEAHRIVLPDDEVTVHEGIPVTTRRARCSTSPRSSRSTNSSSRSTRRSTGGSAARPPSMPSSRGTRSAGGRPT